MKIAIVTSCIAGVAQSRMAALALKTEAEARGFEAIVEEQGGHKMSKRLGPEEIQQADVVVFARAVSISEKGRFAGKKILELPVNKALLDPEGTIDRALALLHEEVP